jgi:ATP-dependent DNA ligase
MAPVPFSRTVFCRPHRLQIHVRDGRVRLYTINGADWSKRYPLIVEAAARINGTAILDAEVVWLGLDGGVRLRRLTQSGQRSMSQCLRF